jgi:hypothetical protein
MQLDTWVSKNLPWLEAALDDHFKKSISAALPTPERIDIEITNACNLNCAMCESTRRQLQQISPQPAK